MLYNGQLWDHKIHFQEINLCRSNQRRLESNQTHWIPCKDLTYQTQMLPAPPSSPLYSFNNHEILRGSPNTLALLKYSQETKKKISNRKGVSEKLSVPKASVVIVAAGEMKTNSAGGSVQSFAPLSWRVCSPSLPQCWLSCLELHTEQRVCWAKKWGMYAVESWRQKRKGSLASAHTWRRDADHFS